MNNNTSKYFQLENQYIFKKYITIKKIGQGLLGDIYSVMRIQDRKLFAMKTEQIIKNKKSRLGSEALYLHELQGFGFPKLISYGHIKKYNILIETLLGKSLYDLYVKKNIKCNIKDLSYIAIQILERLQWIHMKGIVYRDVKPENFCIGIKDPNMIYIIDFGLCQKYICKKTGKHIKMIETGMFNGTLKFASSNAVMGTVSSRRDDLISLGYMLIFLYKLELPWGSKFQELTESKYLEIVMLKKTNDNGNLVKNIPKELEEYINYTQNLKFEEEPNYPYLKYLFNKLLYKNNFTNNSRYISSQNKAKSKENSNRKNKEKLNTESNNKPIYKKITKNNMVQNMKKNIKNKILSTSQKILNSYSRTRNKTNPHSINTSINNTSSFHSNIQSFNNNYISKLLNSQKNTKLFNKNNKNDLKINKDYYNNINRAKNVCPVIKAYNVIGNNNQVINRFNNNKKVNVFNRNKDNIELNNHIYLSLNNSYKFTNIHKFFQIAKEPKTVPNFKKYQSPPIIRGLK